MISLEDFRFMTELTAAVVEAARVRPGESIGMYGPNITGDVLIRPGGRDCYPAFWIRDFAMSLECGLITREEQLHALRLTAERQADRAWYTPTGSFIPKGAIADHINFDGKPIFFPGTMDYEKQGGEKWGYLPALDDHFYFIEMAWRLVMPKQNGGLLNMTISGITLLERLEMAFEVPPVDADGLMVCCGKSDRGVSFGFTDAVVHTGKLLFCSLLRCRAARQLAELFELTGDMEKHEKYLELAERIMEHIPQVFSHDYGLLKASTGTSAQPDVWGSAFAVYYGLLSHSTAKLLAKRLAEALKDGTITWKGGVRHVPTDADFNENTAWEATIIKKNTYQNGAYWMTATGWIIYTVAQINKELAEELAAEYTRNLRNGDFRLGSELGEPWECMHYKDDFKRNPVYMTSVTCPLAAFKRLQKTHN